MARLLLCAALTVGLFGPGAMLVRPAPAHAQQTPAPEPEAPLPRPPRDCEREQPIS